MTILVLALLALATGRTASAQSNPPTTTTMCPTRSCPDARAGIPAFLGKTLVALSNGAEIDASVGVNDKGGTLQIGKRAHAADETRLLADNERIGNASSVFDVVTNHLITGSSVTVRGTTQPLPDCAQAPGGPCLPLVDSFDCPNSPCPFCPIPQIDCSGGAAVIVASGGSETLAPGTYGVVLVKSGGTLTLNGPGTFTFCSLFTSPRTTVLVHGGAPSTINVQGDVRLGSGGSFGPAPGAATPMLNLAGRRLPISAKASLHGFVSAPNAWLTIARDGVFDGEVCFLTSRLDHGGKIECTDVCTTTATVASGSTARN